MVAVPGNAAGVRAAPSGRGDRSAMTATARNGAAPLRRLARAACVLLAAVGLAPAPASAQVVDYISNLRTLSASGSHQTTVTRSDRLSQGFETGSQSGGYPLQEVVLLLSRIGTGNLTVTIRRNSDDGKNHPGTTLYTLTSPASLIEGENTFTAPAGATLAADTRYHIVAERAGTDSGDVAQWNRLAYAHATIDDAGGWNINFSYLRKVAGGNPWAVAPGPRRALAAAVRGERPRVTVTSGGDVTEGGPALFTLVRTGDTTGTLDVTYEVTSSGDFGVATDAGVATFPANSSTVRVSESTAGDGAHEAHGSVTLTLQAGAGYAVGTPDAATARVLDDDNAAPTGAPTIDDTTPVVGETLTADPSGIADPDGLADATFTWRWIRVSGGTDTPIAGATSETYTVAAADVGATLKAEASFTDDDGTDETVESAETDTVGEAPVPTVAVAPVASPVTEGAGAQFRVTRTVTTTGALTVRYSVSETGDMVASDDEDAKTVDFADGEGEKTVTVPTVEDTGHEADSVVTVTLTADADYDLGTGTADVTVEDDDNAAPTGAPTISDTTPMAGETLTADPSGIADPDGLTGATFAWRWIRVSGGTGTPIAGAASETYTVVAADVGATLKAEASFTDDDGIRETVESAATSAVEAPPETLPTVSVARVASPVEEGGNARFTVTRTDVTTGALTVNYSVSETGGDMVASGEEGAKTVDFADGDTQQTVTVPTVEDSVHEADSTVTVALTGDTGAEPAYLLGDPAAATAAVEDDDNAAPTGAPTIDDTTPVVGETLTADESGIADADGLTGATFAWRWIRVSGGTETEIAGATAASYTVVAGDVGSTLKAEASFTDDDGTGETVESVQTATVAAYTITVASPTATEGDTGTPPLLEFALSRSEKGQRVELGWRVAAEGTARAATDFDGPMEGTLVFSPNVLSRTVFFQVIPDTVDESDETVVLELFSVDGTPDGVTFPARVTGTIVDDDTATLSIGPSSVSVEEGDSGTTDLVFTVSADLPSDREVTVEYDVGGTAESGTDYEAPTPARVTFPALVTAREITFRVLGDTDAEWDETVEVDLRDPSGGAELGTTRAEGTILNDDEPVLSVAPPEVDEGDLEEDRALLTFRVTMAGRSDTDVTVDFSVDTGAGTATVGTDFRNRRGTATIESGRTAAIVNVQVVEDTEFELDETVVMVFENPQGAVLDPDSTRVTGTIRNDDLPRVTVAAVAATVTEGTAAAFGLRRPDVDTSEALVVSFTVADPGGVLSGTAPATATIAAGETEETVSLDTADDGVHEAHGSVTLTLAAGAGYVLGPEAERSAEVTVRDDDDSPATGSVTVTGTATEGGTLTVDTSGLTDGDGLANAAWVYQWVRTPPGGGDADISGATSRTYVPVYADAGATLKVRVAVTDDEGHEASFASAPTSVVAALPRAEVTVASAGNVTEGSPAVFTLTRTRDTGQTLDVAYEVAAAGDFGVTPFSGTATFPANSSTVQVSVATTGDGAHEAHGSVTVTLTADTGADPAYLLGAPSTATAAVEDDDDSPATGSVTVTGTAREGQTLTADTSDLADEDGLANASHVYQWVRTPAGGSDADISGATSKTYSLNTLDVGATLKVRVTVTDDEGHEATFTSAPTAAVAALPEVSVMHGGSPITEGGGATFTFTLSKTIGDIPLRVNIRRTETGNMMFPNNLGRSVVVFGPNQTTLTVSYPTAADDTTEPNSTVTVEILERNYYKPGTPSMASVEVRDDDDSPATGTVTVTGTPTEGETLTADTSGITDEDGLDNAAYAWQWVRTPSGGSDADISGATSRTYSLDAPDAGATLKVRVTVTDDEGHQATFTSAPTAAVAALPEVSVMHGGSPITEGGVAAFTFTLSETIGDIPLRVNIRRTETGNMMFPNNLGRSVVVFGPNQTTLTVSYPTVDDDTSEPNSTVTVEILERNYYKPGTPSMAGVEVRDDDDSPATGSVTVTGTATEGETLTADTSGLTDGDGLDNAAYAWQWVRTPSGGSDGDISGATSRTYVPVFADAGATLKVRVTVTDDEGHEATFESAATSAVAALPRAEVTVVPDGDVTEGETVTFTLTRSGDTAGTLDVAYDVTVSGDFGVTTGAGTATFLANDATVQVSVATTDDGAHEAHGSVTVTLTADTDADPAYLLGDPSAATAAVGDDDDSPATGSVTVTGTAAEGGTLTADTSGIADADGLANASYAYRWVRTPPGGGNADISGATSRTYVPVFADGGTTLKVRVTVTDDEGHEATFTSAETAVVPPSVTVTPRRTGPVSEGDPAAEFTVTRTGDTTAALRVRISVSETGDMVSAGNEGGNKFRTLPAGQSSAVISVPTVDDGVHEADSVVTLTLEADAAYELGTQRSAEVTVEDDDDSPATGSVTVTGTAAEGGTLTADTSGLTDADGLANAAYTYQWVRTPAGGGGADISGATSRTYVPVYADAGATLKVRVAVTDDEGHEATFESAPTPAVAAAARPSVTVASDGDVTEGGAAVFTLTRTGDTAEELDVAYSVTATGDFGVTTGAGTATFPANNDTVRVSVATTGDGAHEARGSVTVALTADTGADPAYLLGDPAAAAAAVEDDDDSPATGSVAVTGTAVEGGTLTADTSGLADGDGLDDAAWVYQWVRTPAGGGGADISGATSRTYVPVYADAGATLKVRVAVTDDEGHEATFESAPTSAVAAAARPSVTVASDGDVTEGGAAVFTLTRTGDTAEELDVAYSVTATGDFGVTTGAGTATFPANNATVRVSVATTGDGAHEARGSVTVALTADTGADPAYLLGAPSTATAAVEDDDDSPATGSVTVTGTAREGQTLTADTSGLADGDGLANASYVYQWVRTPSGDGDADISGATSRTYVPVYADAGATLKVRVTVTDDEGHEATFESAPTSAVAALPRAEVTVVPDGDVTEGDTVTFTLTRTGDTAEELDVAYSVTATGDFGVTTGAGTATFPANNATVRVSVATTGDGAHEAHGSVTVALTADTGADPAYLPGDPAAATAAVEDDDDSPATGSVTVTGTAREGQTLTADTSGLADGDGLANASYVYQWVRTPAGGSDADISGATSKTYVPVFADAGATLKVRVTVTDDEGHEATFASAATSAVAALLRAEVTVVPDGDVTEGDTVAFTLTRTGDTAGTLDLAYAVTATGNFGVTPFSGTATFPANGSTVQVSVATTGDSTHEAHGSVTMALTADTGADPAYLLGDPSTATAAVEDDDDSPASGAVTVTTATTFTESETLTADTSGLADGDGLANAAYAYQWVRTPSGGSDADISGATSRTYVPVYADAGATLKVRVTVTDDEGHEATFESAPSSAVVAAARPSVTVASDGDVTEGAAAVFTLTRTGDLAQTLDVAYAVTASGDFGVTPFSGTATFLANSPTVRVTVATTGDSAHEARGSVTVVLTADAGADPAYLPGDPAAATAAVEDDDDSPATGSVTVTGTTAEGGTLTADTSGIIDADGLDNAAWVYQWVRTSAGGGDADISGATGAAYVPVFADTGATLKVGVTVTDDEGHEAEFTSVPTSTIAAAPRPSVTVASDGDVTEGGPAVFTLTRTGDTAEELDVAYAVAATGDFGAATGAGTATFPANGSTVRVSVATTGDGAHEAHGSVTVALTADGGADPAYLLGDPAAATAAVEDDDDSPATGTVTITGTATERGTLTADTSGLADADGLANATYTYQWVRTLSGGSDADISGAISKTYVPVFADAGATLKVRVTVTDDEGHEATFESAPSSAVAAAARPSVTVVPDGDVTEGDTVTFTLTRTGATARTLDVAYTVTATGDFGVTTGAGTATFPADSVTVQVTVATAGDSTHEAHGSVTVALTADTGADPAYLPGDPAAATAAVEDDDDSPATGSVTITGTATERATLTADTSGLADADGLANATYTWQWVRTLSGGSDADISGATSKTYVPVFADAGATLKVRVTVTDDEGHEATFESAPSSAVAAAARPSVTVVPDGDVTEGDTVTFTLTRTGATAEELDVAYAVAATGDFGVTTGAGTATFPANGSTVRVSVATTGDGAHEAHGTVTVTLTADTGADPAYLPGAPSTATAAIRDDDNAAPTGAVTIDDTTPVVGETLTADASNLDDPDGLTSRSFTWQWLRVSGGTQTPIAGATSASYTVGAGDVGATLKVRAGFTDDDGTGETVESAQTSAAEPPSPVLTVAAGPSPVTEGTAATFTVTRAAVTSGALTARYRVSETGDAVAASGEGSRTVDFADGETGKTLTVATVRDGVHEADSVVTVTLVPDAAYDLGPEAQRSASVTVADDDNAAPTGAPTIDDTTPVAGQTLSADASGIGDPDGLPDRRFTWQWLRVSGGTATEIAGATSASYTVAAADIGSALKVRAGFTDDGGAGETVESAPTLAVGAYTIAVTTPTVTEGDGGLTILEFAVIRSETAQRVKLGWRLAESGTAQAGKGKDFAGPTQGTLDFPRGMTVRFVFFQVLPDFIDESDETVTLEFFAVDGTPAGVTFPPTVTGTILDDDTSTVSVAPSRGVDEGDAGTRELAFTVSMDHPSDREVTVVWDVGGTAESGTDYLAPTPALVTFPALSWEPQRIVFDVVGDTDVERNETVAVELRDPSGGAVLGTSRAEGTIRNDDGLVVSVDPPEVVEGDSHADGARLTFRLALSGQADTDVTVDYRVDAGAGTATAGADFKDKSGTVRVKSGRTFAVVKLGILEDTAAEPDETVVMVFENPRGAVLEPGSGRVTGTILDDDLARVTVAAEAGAVTEGNDAVFVLRRTGDASAPLTVAVDVGEAGRVLAGTAPASVTFGESETEARLRIPTSDDSTAEADGRVTATVTAGPGYAVDAGTGAGTAGVDVLDNDAPVAPEGTVTLWSTTMTVAKLGGWVGWVGASGPDLADPDWSEDGVEYALELLRWFGPWPSLVQVRFNRRPPSVEELTLHAGGLTLALAEEGGSGQTFAWSSVEGDPWPVGEEVELRLTRTVADEGHDGAAGPGISVADAQVHESAGTPLAFRVTLDEARSSAVSVRYATSDVSATAGADYVAASGVVRFEAGETAKTVNVAVLEDAHDEGEETMTLTLSSPFGAEVSDGTATGTIVNTDAMPRAWLGRFGRTVAGQVVDAVEARMTAVRQPGVEVSVAGRGVGAAGAFDEAVSRGGHAADGRLAEWLAGGVDSEERAVNGRELLTGTSFALTEGTAESGFVSLWGRGVVTDFDGREGELSVDGEVVTGLLGADWARDDRAAGLIVGHSRGDGSYSGQGAGTVSSSLTGLYPWGRRALNDRVTVWGVAGYGEGTLTLEPEGQARIETDMDLAMAAAGLRGVLMEAPAEGGLELEAKTDGLIVRSASDGAQGSDGGIVEAASARVTRLRLGLEGTRAFRSEGGRTLTSSFGLGVRHDGGNAETGFGVDVGAGLAYADPSSGMAADLRGRGLLAHEASGFREVGLSGSLAFDPSPSSDRGLSLSLSQTVGVSETGGVDALLYGRDTMAGLGGTDAGAGAVDSPGRRRLEARVGYGVSAFGGRFTGTPELGFGLSESGRDYRLGWRLTPAGGNTGAFEPSAEVTRREDTNDDGSEHGVGVRATIRW